MKYEVISDQVVTFEDAEVWCEELFRIKPTDIITTTLRLEPAALGVAANLVHRACERLESEGISEQHREYIFTQSVRASAVAVELMRRGYAKFLADLLQPDDEPKED
jgi:hypothetical protein